MTDVDSIRLSRACTRSDTDESDEAFLRSLLSRPVVLAVSKPQLFHPASSSFSSSPEQTQVVQRSSGLPQLKISPKFRQFLQLVTCGCAPAELTDRTKKKKGKKDHEDAFSLTRKKGAKLRTDLGENTKSLDVTVVGVSAASSSRTDSEPTSKSTPSAKPGSWRPRRERLFGDFFRQQPVSKDSAGGGSAPASSQTPSNLPVESHVEISENSKQLGRTESSESISAQSNRLPEHMYRVANDAAGLQNSSFSAQPIPFVTAHRRTESNASNSSVRSNKRSASLTIPRWMLDNGPQSLAEMLQAASLGDQERTAERELARLRLAEQWPSLYEGIAGSLANHDHPPPSPDIPWPPSPASDSAHSISSGSMSPLAHSVALSIDQFQPRTDPQPSTDPLPAPKPSNARKPSKHPSASSSQAPLPSQHPLPTAKAKATKPLVPPLRLGTLALQPNASSGPHADRPPSSSRPLLSKNSSSSSLALMDDAGHPIVTPSSSRSRFDPDAVLGLTPRCPAPDSSRGSSALSSRRSSLSRGNTPNHSFRAATPDLNPYIRFLQERGEEVRFEGDLWWQDGPKLHRRWVLRWTLFLLAGSGRPCSILHYFKKKQVVMESGAGPSKERFERLQFSRLQCKVQDEDDTGSGKPGFILSINGQIFWLVADTAALRDTWVNTIRKGTTGLFHSRSANIDTSNLRLEGAQPTGFASSPRT